MAFIFDAIKNNTYNVFCQCLQYILVFLYSLEIFSDTDLLCKDLVLCGLIWQGIVFIFYIVNFVICLTSKYTDLRNKSNQISLVMKMVLIIRRFVKCQHGYSLKHSFM